MTDKLVHPTIASSTSPNCKIEIRWSMFSRRICPGAFSPNIQSLTVEGTTVGPITLMLILQDLISSSVCGPCRPGPPFMPASITEGRTRSFNVCCCSRPLIKTAERCRQSPCINSLAVFAVIPGPLMSIRTSRSLSVVSTPCTTPEGVKTTLPSLTGISSRSSKVMTP